MSLKKIQIRNPYISLMKTAWKYANEEKKRYLLIYGMFAVSNTVHALNPIIWGMVYQ